MEKLILGSQNTVSKYNRPTQVLVVLLSGVSSNASQGGGGGGGGYSLPPHWQVDQNAEWEKYYVL